MTSLLRPKYTFRFAPFVAFVGLTALAGGCADDPNATLDPTLIHTVERGPLVITVRERGELEAAQNTRILSEVEGRATLIHLVPEGSVVKKGDVLAELDMSAIAEKRALEEISLAKAEAGVQQARKIVEIMEKELRAAESSRESELEVAILRARKLLGQPRSEGASTRDSTEGTNGQVLEELRALLAPSEAAPEAPSIVISDAAANAAAAGADRRSERAQQPVSEDLEARIIALFDGEANLALQMGEMGNQILQLLRQINLARSDLELATETLRYSEQLAAEGFMTRSELNRDRIDFQRRLADMSLAWSNLELLITYTLPESRITARQGVADAELALESQRAAAEARRVRESSELARAESELVIARQNFARLEEQLAKGVLRAPGPGLVVYGRYDWDEPVYEGMEIRERQEVVVLPDVSKMVAKLLVPEAQIDQVAAGQTARIIVDAFPGREFQAQVASVSTLPDVQGSWRRDVKVYGVRVEVTGENAVGALRPGMNSTVEIQIATLADVLAIPLTALERAGERRYVWKSTPNGPTAVEVEVGRSNLTHVEILSGLREGERVHLVPPEGARAPTFSEVRGARPSEPEAPSVPETSGTSAVTEESTAPAPAGPGDDAAPVAPSSGTSSLASE
ncbi:MAG: efflux RND transporter periplasmic adaptor subunit [Planctomycetota bacterium]